LAERLNKRRRALLAAIHMGNNALGLEDSLYRDLLESEFGVRSAGDLTEGQMVRLLGIYRQWGFDRDPKKRVAALRARARDIAANMPDGDVRLQGLTLKLCGVNRLEWCHDVKKLERLLAALGKIYRSEV